MKCTSMFALAQAIKRISLAELRKAVEAHGNSYEWEDYGCAPIVILNTDWAGPMDVYIKRVFINDAQCLDFEAVDKESEEIISGVDFDDIEETHIQYIMEYMEDAGEVDDVSSYGIQGIIESFISHVNALL